MTFEDTRAADTYVANIVAGRVWHAYPNFQSTTNVDATTIQARLEFRTHAGADVIASCATSGGGAADGTITITQIGSTGDGIWYYEAHCYLPDTVTELLTPSVDPDTGALQQAGVGDLKLWAPSVDAGGAQDGGDWVLRIEAEVTE